MNPETIIQVMKFMRDTCKANTTCIDCIFRIIDEYGGVECGLAETASNWKINEPRKWKAFKE